MDGARTLEVCAPRVLADEMLGEKAWRFVVFPTADVSDFGADIKLVTFAKTACPDDTIPTRSK